MGRDYVKWALDDDYTLLHACVSRIGKVTNIEQADIIHTVNWKELKNIDNALLRSKIVFANIPHDITNMMICPEFWDTFRHVNRYVVPTTRAKVMLEDIGISSFLLPNSVNPTIFFKKNFCNISLSDKPSYLIGSFQRDTEGKDLKTPKYVKGPDVFLSIVRGVYKEEKNIRVVLAGPRRFWLRNKLTEYGIPYTFVGDKLGKGDDLLRNTLKFNKINDLYNLVDLYLVSSRMEGGPKAILEASASKCKIISSDVGCAQDILNPKCIYESIPDAVSLILLDIKSKSLDSTIEEHYKKALSRNIGSNDSRLKMLYSLSGHVKSKTISRKPKRSAPGNIAIAYKCRKAPWGGGNQFIKALKRTMGSEVLDDLTNDKVIGCIVNSFHIDNTSLTSYRKLKLIHRIDGPTFLIRGKDHNLDVELFKFNNTFADYTVFQSMWSLVNNIKLGLIPVNPVLIGNAVDPKIFNTNTRKKFSRDRKIRLISSSWSDNVNKGWETFKWLDENLDWSKYEYTFVGRVPGTFKNIKVLKPVDSMRLSRLLQKNDIYITASKNDTCSNAVVEALACGLPTIYLESGGHQELVGFGGLGFKKGRQIPEKLEILVSNYELFKGVVLSNNIRDIANRYLELYK
jgi:glycosyltransferase involved in cell wall biosynthesis